MFKLILRTELIKTRLLCITPLAGCSCSIRNIMQRPVTKLPAQSTKGTKLKRYDVPPSRIGVLKSWDSRHTGMYIYITDLSFSEVIFEVLH